MDGKCLVAYIITERQPFGPDGPKWYILHTFFVLNVLKLKREDKKLRLLFVCPPFCFPLFWSPKVTSVSFDTLESKKPTVMVVQWMILVVRVLAPESAKLAFSFLDEKVSGCFLFLWYIIYAGMGQFGHVSAATLAVVGKNMMGHAFEPLPSGVHQPAAHGAGEDEDRRLPYIVSANQRRQLNDPKKARGGDSGVKHDCNYQRRLVSTLSTAGAVHGVSSEDAVSLVFDRVAEGLDGNTPAASYRRSSLMGSDVIFDETLDNRHNSWRRGKGRVVVTSGQCEANDLNLAEIIWNDSEVWVVTEEGATPPEDGTLITNKYNATGKYWPSRRSSDTATTTCSTNGLARRREPDHRAE
mmetsp:Transcript_23233/g.53339  ORF Transcript_23233/g.53339 Transcript_23233/m.53339 type:complete len:355 (+) Transcript_23233:1651-2715(+)